MPNSCVTAFNCSVRFAVAPPAFAVRVAVSFELTADAVAMNATLVALADTVTEAGTATAALLLDRFTVTAEGPEELSVIVQASVAAPVIDVLSQVSALNAGAAVAAAGVRFNAKVFEVLPAVAVSVADWAVLTAEIAAGKVALDESADTVTLAGTETEESLLERATVKPPVGAAAPSSTVQLSVPAPVKVELVQVKPLTGGVTRTPSPLRSIDVVGSDVALLITESCPDAAPAPTGSNSTVKVNVAPEATETGNLTVPAIENG